MKNYTLQVILSALIVCATYFGVSKTENTAIKNTALKALFLNPNDNYNITDISILPSASISGSTTVCQFTSPVPQITFTGSGDWFKN